jgi:hypothetical protein
MPDDTIKYVLIDLENFLREASLNKYIFNTIINSNWSVTSLVAQKYLGVGVKDNNMNSITKDDDPFVMFVNGSTYIHNNCIVNGSMIINSDLVVAGNTNLSTLSVNTFKTLYSADINILNVSNSYNLNTSINNLSVDNINISSSFITNCDAYFKNNLNVSNDSNFYNNVSINKNLNVLQNASINTIDVMNNAFFYKNISVPLLYAINSSIRNISSYNIDVNEICNINQLNSSSLNVTNTASLNILNVNSNTIHNTLFCLENTSLYNVSVTNKTTMTNDLTVNGNIINTGNITTNGNITTSNLKINTNTNINGTVEFNNVSAVIIRGPIESNSTIKMGSTIGPGATWYEIQEGGILFDVQGNAHIKKLYATNIICPNIDNTTTLKQSIDNQEFEVKNKNPAGNNCYSYIGEVNTPIRSVMSTYGAFMHGIPTFTNSLNITYTNAALQSQNFSSTFDLNAISKDGFGIVYDGNVQIGNNVNNILNLKGNGTIIYDGSMNIGQDLSKNTEFNLSATGIINYDGSMNIGQNLSTEFNLNGNGIINYDGSMNIGQNLTTTNVFNLNGNGIINYDGSMNIGQNKLSEFNLSSKGKIFYDGIMDLNVSSIGNGIKYYGLLDVSGEFNLDGNINLTGNVYSRSDIKIKNNIIKLENTLSKISNINGYSYNRCDLINTSKIHIGLIAQEVETEYPEIISEENNIKTINYTSIIAILIESIKDLKKEINQLKLK